MTSDETITIQYKRYHHLRTITSLLLLILAIFGFRIVRACTLEIGVRQIIQKYAILKTEQVLFSLIQLLFYMQLIFQQFIRYAIKTVIAELHEVNAKQLINGDCL